MSTYAIGDIQGCYHELIELLEALKFDKIKINSGLPETLLIEAVVL